MPTDRHLDAVLEVVPIVSLRHIVTWAECYDFVRLANDLDERRGAPRPSQPNGYAVLSFWFLRPWLIDLASQKPVLFECFHR